MFCIICQFNELRVAKLTRLATSGRSLHWPMFSGMAWINFSRAKMSAANQANLLGAVGQDISVVGREQQEIDLRVGIMALQRADSSMIDYRDDSLAIPDKVPDRTALPK